MAHLFEFSKLCLVAHHFEFTIVMVYKLLTSLTEYIEKRQTMPTTRTVEYHSVSVSESANVVANDEIAPVPPPCNSGNRAPVVVRRNFDSDQDRMRCLKKVLTITIVVISMLVIISSMFTKSGDKDASAKI